MAVVRLDAWLKVGSTPSQLPSLVEAPRGGQTVTAGLS